MGIVYVLENKAMPGMVKIGHTTEQTIQQRLRNLDKTGVPLPFECIAAWEFEDAPGVEKTLHEVFKSKRVRKAREFFRVSPDQPIAILERFGARNVTPQDDIVGSEDSDAEDDRSSLKAARERRERFRFSQVGITPGTVLQSVWDENIECQVIDDRQVEFEGEIISLSAAARKVLDRLGKNWKSVSGPDSWKSKGYTLTALRELGEI